MIYQQVKASNVELYLEIEDADGSEIESRLANPRVDRV